MTSYQTNALQGSKSGIGLIVSALMPAAFMSSPGTTTPQIFEPNILGPVFQEDVVYGPTSSLQSYEVLSKSDANERLMSAASDFYGRLVSEQEMLGKDFEEAIASRISDLYEE